MWGICSGILPRRGGGSLRPTHERTWPAPSVHFWTVRSNPRRRDPVRGSILECFFYQSCARCSGMGGEQEVVLADRAAVPLALAADHALGARAKKIEHLWHHMKCAVRQGYQRIPCIAGEKSFCRLPVVLRRHCQGKRPHCGQHRVELIRGPPVSAANRALSELGRDGDADGYASGFQSGGAPGNFSAGPANRLGQDVRIRHVPRFRHTRRRSSGFAGGSAMSGKSSSRETSRDRTSARGGSPRTGSRMRT